MSVLIYIDHAQGLIKKSSLEAISYGVALASKLNTKADALVLGNTTLALTELGKYGLQKIYQDSNEVFHNGDSQVITSAIKEAQNTIQAEILIFSQNAAAETIAPRVSIALGASLATGIMGLPDLEDGFVVKRTVFSGKAYEKVKLTAPVKVLSVSPNSFDIYETGGNTEITNLNLKPKENKVRITGTELIQGEIPLTEAEIVVSGGRGLKGPENWHLIKDLAHALHGAMACSRPVADDGWRPHHEHVGQTGLQIAPNLYIAVGISGAIQHLGGVNRSKVIVVINKDPEAPFFKAADYGIQGDAFEVVPKLIEAIMNFKG